MAACRFGKNPRVPNVHCGFCLQGRAPSGLIQPQSSLTHHLWRYIDKTQLIAQVIDGSEIRLYTRPRRFGKTLALSTLHAFLERHDEDRSELFQGLAINDPKHGERYRQHQQRYPVVTLSFRNIKGPDWTSTELVLRQLLTEELLRLRQLGYFRQLDSEERRQLASWLEPQAPLAAYEGVLKTISRWLARESGEPVVILIDEYDTPLHSAHVGGYYAQAVGFFRNLLTAGLKDNPNLYRGVLTGILRVAKEGLFSGLNNLQVLTLKDPISAPLFGFTDAEVRSLAQEHGLADRMDDIRAWYNGYRFGGGIGGEPTTLYNPWSVLSYLSRPTAGMQPYWVNTSDNALLREMLTSRGYRVEQELMALLQGGTIHKTLPEFISLPQLAADPDALWSFLLMAGYLRLEGPIQPFDAPQALTLPNREVEQSYKTSFLSWLQENTQASGDEVRRWCQALVRGEQEFAQAGLQELFANVLSYHELGPRAAEVVYQAFVLGLLVNLRNTHRVRSNREAGFGRYDVIIAPKEPGGPGVVLEFERMGDANEATVQAPLDRGIAQIRAKGYANELSEARANPQHAIAIACHGKHVWLRSEEL